MLSDAVREIAVIVPAHDEQATIRACLSSITTAARDLPDGIRVRTIAVLDCCSDETARRVHDGVTTVVCSARCVGSARALGAARAIEESGVSLHELWLANTDADSRVPFNWLSHTLRRATAGADVLLGTALPEPNATNRALIRRWHGMHALRSGHPYVHGANFGIRADVYTQAGGWPALVSGEDVDLAARAGQISARVERCADMPVRTSSRLHGRAPAGYARFLHSLAAPADAGRAP